MPRIASIEVRALAPDVERFRYTSFQDEVYTTTTLVQITDDAGTVGLGAYDSDSYGDWDRSPLETLRTIVPRLMDVDPDDHDPIATLLSEDGTSPFPPAVRSTIDMACWDLAARRAGQPLHILLGGDRRVDEPARVRLGADVRFARGVPGGDRGLRRPGVHRDQGARLGRAGARRGPAASGASAVRVADPDARRGGTLRRRRRRTRRSSLRRRGGHGGSRRPCQTSTSTGTGACGPTCRMCRSSRPATRSGMHACSPTRSVILPGTRFVSTCRSWAASRPHER